MATHTVTYHSCDWCKAPLNEEAPTYAAHIHSYDRWVGCFREEEICANCNEAIKSMRRLCKRNARKQEDGQ